MSPNKIRNDESIIKSQQQSIVVVEKSNFSDLEFLKYPNILLRIFGLFHRPEDPLVLKIYALTFCFIDWLNLARFISAFEIFYGRSEPLLALLILKIISALWYFICAINSTIIYVNQESVCRQRAFITYIHPLLAALDTKRRHTITKHVYLINILSSSFILLNVVVISVSFFGPKVLFSGFQTFLAPFHDSEWAKDSIPYKCLIIVFTVVTTSHFMLSNALYMSHCIIVIHLLCAFNTKFNDFVHDSVLVASENR